MRRYIVLALLATMLAGCVKDNTKDLAIEVGAEKVFATIEACESGENRVQLNEQLQTVWTKDDKIMIFFDGGSKICRFDGETGDRSGSFTVIQQYAMDGFSAQGKHYALHSYDPTQTMFGSYGDGSLALFTTVPNVQNYIKGSYSVGANVMLGESSDGESFVFRNVLGYLRLSIEGSKIVQSIVLTSNDQSPVTGMIAMMARDISIWQIYQNATDTVTLDCGSGVQLSDTPSEFYIALPPVTFAKGFSVTVNFTDGTQFVQQTIKEIAIERNCIQPMATFRTNIDESEYQKIYIYHTGTTVAAPMVEASGNASIDWGDGNVSLLNQFTSYTYTDGRDSHIITIKSIDAKSLAISSMRGVTKIDLSNF